MVLPRTSAFGRMFRSSVARTARLRSTAQTWRTAGRRTYASDHGPAKKSSDLPWMIGSVAVTVPSAAWLWQQGPKKGDHGHGHDEHAEHVEHEEPEEGEAESKDEGGEEVKDEGEERSKEDAEVKSDDGDKADSGEKEESSDSESSGGKETPSTSDDDDLPEDQVRKGKGEQQKGETRPRTETQEEKSSAKDVSGASNPYLDDPEKSKKGEGVKDTSKIHGTVDPQRNVRGPGDGEQPNDQGDKKEKAKDKPSSVQS